MRIWRNRRARAEGNPADAWEVHVASLSMFTVTPGWLEEAMVVRPPHAPADHVSRFFHSFLCTHAVSESMFAYLLSCAVAIGAVDDTSLKSMPPASSYATEPPGGAPSATASVLLQARTGLTTALREVRACRTDKARCQEELSVCKSAATAPKATNVSHVHSLEHALAKARGDLAAHTKAYSDLRTKTESFATAARAQLSSLKESLKTVTAASNECQMRLTAIVGRDVRQLQMLKRSLEQKDALEDAIDGRQAKLTDIYKALEVECQAELSKCKSSRSHADDADGEAAGSHQRGTHWLLLASFAMGAATGWVMRGARTQGWRLRLFTRASTTHVEEMTGWIPISTADMKLS